MGRARDWLRSQTLDSFTTWEELTVAFLNKYFPPSKMAYYRNQITNFAQMDGETLYEAWERYTEYQKLCPHHNLDDLLVFHTFYHGVDGPSRLALDTAVEGAIMDLEPHEGYAVIEKITNNYFMWGSERGNPRRRGERHEVKVVSTSDYEARCDICEVYEHETNSCPLIQRDGHRIGYEEENYVGGNQGREYGASATQGQNSQSNYTTPRFSTVRKNHPNFLYKTTNPTRPDFGTTPPGFGPKPTSTNQAFPPKNQFQPMSQYQGQQYQAQPQRPYVQVDHPPRTSNEPSGVEEMLARLLAHQEKMNAKQDEIEAQLMEMRQNNQRMETHNKMLENQIAQQAESST
ncbi:unnamed protein product [Rhodiola kirilowii]